MALMFRHGGAAERFQLKLIEILEKGFREKEPHNFVRDIELSRSLYKVKTYYEIEYFVVTALLNLPSLSTETNFMFTLRNVLTFYDIVLKTHITNFTSMINCLKAIEDCCLHSDHIRDREATAFIIHFLYQAGILNLESVIDCLDSLVATESSLLEEENLNRLISWMQHESVNHHSEYDDKPASYWLNYPSPIVPFHIWVKKADEYYKPSFIWARPNGQYQVKNYDNQSEQEYGQLSDYDDEFDEEYEVPIKYHVKNFMQVCKTIPE